MNTTIKVSDTLRHPSAFLPVAMSFIALVVVLGDVAMFGTAREPDEGAAAHIWQLLMVGQMPIILFFIVRWLPKVFRPALLTLALQIGAALAAIAPVYFLHL